MPRYYRLREPFWCWIPGGLLLAAGLPLLVEAGLMAFRGDSLYPSSDWERLGISLLIVLYSALLPLIAIALLIIRFAKKLRGKVFRAQDFIVRTTVITAACLILAPIIGGGLANAIPRVQCDGVVGMVLCSISNFHLVSVVSIFLMFLFPLAYLTFVGLPAALALIIFPLTVLQRVNEGAAPVVPHAKQGETATAPDRASN